MAESVGVGEDGLQQALAYAGQKLHVERLNEKQVEAVTAFIRGKDVFVSLPMGYGKSVCFQSVPFVLDYIRGWTDKCTAIIIEPTAAVMQDQVFALKKQGDLSRVYKSGANLNKQSCKGKLSLFISLQCLHTQRCFTHRVTKRIWLFMLLMKFTAC